MGFFSFLLRLRSGEAIRGNVTRKRKSLKVWFPALLASLKRMFPQSSGNINWQTADVCVLSSLFHWAALVIIIFLSPGHLTHLPPRSW